MAPRHESGEKRPSNRGLGIYFMRDDQPYYYFDGYKMGQEEKKSKEHQGHHCSGKCTQLETSVIVTDGQSKEVFFRCSSVFDGIERTKPKEKEPFWLKVGDVIRRKNDSDHILKILRVTDMTIEIEGLANSFFTGSTILSISDFGKNIGVEEEFKKIKLVSPAISMDPENHRYYTSFQLFSSKEDARRHHTVDVIWPAKDQFGKEIWYEVEE